MIPSPCIKICKLNSNNICIGCNRSIKEIENWNTYSDSDKQHILNRENIISTLQEELTTNSGIPLLKNKLINIPQTLTISTKWFTLSKFYVNPPIHNIFISGVVSPLNNNGNQSIQFRVVNDSERLEFCSLTTIITDRCATTVNLNFLVHSSENLLLQTKLMNPVCMSLSNFIIHSH